MAVTVIGGRGFVGSRLVARLQAQGQDVWVPAKGDPKMFGRDLGTVFYCAGLTADYARRPFDTVAAHVELASALVKEGRFERIVYLSSTRLYDAGPSGRARGQERSPLTLDPANPRALYDLSKALGENLVLTQTDGRGRVARLANVFDWAPGSPGFLSEWLVQAAQSRDLTLDSSPAIARDYIHLDDVVLALEAIAQTPEPAIYNVAGGELTTNAQLARTFEAAGWRVRFTRDGQPAAPPAADISAMRALGVAPARALDVVADYLRSEATR